MRRAISWPASTVVLILLGMALIPGRGFADEGGTPAPAVLAGADAPSVEAVSPGGYVFPSPRDQFKDWAMNAAGPAAIAGNLVGASWRQWVTEEPIEWGDDRKSFAKRFGAGSLTTAIGETTLSLTSAAMRQDARFYRSPRAGLGPRLRHSLAMTFMARDREGRAVFSPGKTFSPFVGPVVTHTAVYPGSQTYVDGLVSGLYGLLINAAWNAAREFVVPATPWDTGREPVR